MFDCSPRDIERVTRVCAITLLLNARRSATLVTLDAVGFSDAERNIERARAAWACEVPFALFAGALPSPERLREQWRGQCAGLAAANALRERFDHDWYRNPRVAETLRGAAARSGELAALAWLEELGGAAEHSGTRITELHH
jgi:hypothetical protein